MRVSRVTVRRPTGDVEVPLSDLDVEVELVVSQQGVVLTGGGVTVQVDFVSVGTDLECASVVVESAKAILDASATVLPDIVDGGALQEALAGAIDASGLDVGEIETFGVSRDVVEKLKQMIALETSDVREKARAIAIVGKVVAAALGVSLRLLLPALGVLSEDTSDVPQR